MIRELDAVVLLKNLPKHGLSRGDVGMVVLLHGNAGYGVEFLSTTGETVAVISVDKELVRPAGADDKAQP